MKFFLLSDNQDSLLGLRLVGIEGLLIKGKEELKNALDTYAYDEDIAVILISESLADLLPDYIDHIKLTDHTAMIVDIPNREGSIRSENYIGDYVKEAIGFKLS